MANKQVSVREYLPAHLLDPLTWVIDACNGMQLPAFLVGGILRDYFLQVPSSDLDIVVEGDAIALGLWLAENNGGTLKKHKQFGTAKWYLPVTGTAPTEYIDLITARTETYRSPAALPRVRFASLKDDLLRRDFSINAMAISLSELHTSHIIDPTGGMNDLRDKQIRVLHDESFRDDPTRAFRAVRLEQRLGFRLEPHTEDLLRADVRNVQLLSGDRIRHELDLCLLEPRAVRIISRLQELGVFNTFLSDFAFPGESARALEVIQESEAEPEVLLHYMALLHSVSPPVTEQFARRCAFSLKARKALVDAAELRQELPGLSTKSPSARTFALDVFTPAAIRFHEITSMSPETAGLLNEYLNHDRHITPFTTGEDLKRRGLPPGVQYAKVLKALRAAWLDRVLTSEAKEKEYLERLLQ